MDKKNREREVHSVGEAIRDLLNSYKLTTKFDETHIINSWESLVGKPVARQTKKLYIRNKVLFVEFMSPTMRKDFSLNKSAVLEVFKKEFGAGVITEIIVM